MVDLHIRRSIIKISKNKKKFVMRKYKIYKISMIPLRKKVLKVGGGTSKNSKIFQNKELLNNRNKRPKYCTIYLRKEILIYRNRSFKTSTIFLRREILKNRNRSMILK